MHYALDREVVQRRKNMLYGELMMDLVPFPPPSMNSWTQHMYYCCHIFLTYLLLINSIL